jgi:thiamine biosynthesis lipoprotein ApbE
MQQTGAQVEQGIAALDRFGITDQAGSELQRINEAVGNGRSIAVSGELLNLLTKARALSQTSAGSFNTAVDALTAL